MLYGEHGAYKPKHTCTMPCRKLLLCLERHADSLSIWMTVAHLVIEYQDCSTKSLVLAIQAFRGASTDSNPRRPAA
eukprot:5029406-Amphidinium_carterae.1